MNVAPIVHPSANFGARPAGAEIDILLLHYTGMASAQDALARLCDPAAGVSAHYLVDEAGRVFSLVSEAARAWHAGAAAWAGETAPVASAPGCTQAARVNAANTKGPAMRRAGVNRRPRKT